MMLRLRIGLPDRPGSLGRVSRALGALGADILSVTVLDHSGGRVVDDFTVNWPGYPGQERLESAMTTIGGVTIDGAWPTTAAPDSSGDLDVLGHVCRNPARAMITLLDAIPGIFSADWAVLADLRATEPGTAPVVRQSSWQAPADPQLPVLPTPRPMSMDAGPDVHIAAIPAGEGTVLYLARSIGPTFHRVELARLARLVEIVLAIVGTRVKPDAVAGDLRT
ncbi:MAG: ACT domain-containing protein [Sporichthyaceae bacterium]